MPVDITIASTFEFARDWLASSPLLVECLLAGSEFDGPDPLEAAKARIYCEEVWVEPDVEREGETAPDLPPPVYPVPRATVITVANRRECVATGTHAGWGTLNIVIAVLAPEEFQISFAPGVTPTERAAKFKARREWAARLMQQIRSQLLETSGGSDGAGNPYLYAKTCNPVDVPMDLDESEPVDGVAWVYEVDWQ